jgi:hypothetical protein
MIGKSNGVAVPIRTIGTKNENEAENEINDIVQHIRRRNGNDINDTVKLIKGTLPTRLFQSLETPPMLAPMVRRSSLDRKV